MVQYITFDLILLKIGLAAGGLGIPVAEVEIT